MKRHIELSIANKGEQVAIHEIRNEISKKYGQNIAERVIIQYGGSVKSTNSQELFSMPDIDGGLVGGASLNAEEFSKIANS